MSASIVIDGTPSARISGGQEYGRWIAVQFGDDCALCLPGREAECAAYARRLARVLEAAADALAQPASEDDVARVVATAYAPVLGAIARGEAP